MAWTGKYHTKKKRLFSPNKKIYWSLRVCYLYMLSLLTSWKYKVYLELPSAVVNITCKQLQTTVVALCNFKYGIFVLTFSDARKRHHSKLNKCDCDSNHEVPFTLEQSGLSLWTGVHRRKAAADGNWTEQEKVVPRVLLLLWVEMFTDQLLNLSESKDTGDSNIICITYQTDFPALLKFCGHSLIFRW